MPLKIRTAGRGVYWTLTRFNSGASSAVERIKGLLWQMLRGPSEGWLTFILLLLSVIMAI